MATASVLSAGTIEYTAKSQILKKNDLRVLLFLLLTIPVQGVINGTLPRSGGSKIDWLEIHLTFELAF